MKPFSETVKQLLQPIYQQIRTGIADKTSRDNISGILGQILEVKTMMHAQKPSQASQILDWLNEKISRYNTEMLLNQLEHEYSMIQDRHSLSLHRLMHNIYAQEPRRWILDCISKIADKSEGSDYEIRVWKNFMKLQSKCKHNEIRQTGSRFNDFYMYILSRLKQSHSGKKHWDELIVQSTPKKLEKNQYYVLPGNSFADVFIYFTGRNLARWSYGVNPLTAEYFQVFLDPIIINRVKRIENGQTNETYVNLLLQSGFWFHAAQKPNLKNTNWKERLTVIESYMPQRYKEVENNCIHQPWNRDLKTRYLDAISNTFIPLGFKPSAETLMDLI
jgi:hypothetical protein